MVSRATQEVILAFTFALAALLTLQAGFKTKTIKGFVSWLGLYAVFSLLATYSYHATKITLPLLSLLLWWVAVDTKYLPKLTKFSKTLSSSSLPKMRWAQLWLVGIVFISLLSLGLTTTSEGGLSRFEAVGIISDQGPQLVVDEQIRITTPYQHQLVTRFFHNKLVGYSQKIIEIYTSHFTFSFLFLGGGQPGRYKIPFHGLMYLGEAVLLAIGAMVVIGRREHRHYFYDYHCPLKPKLDSLFIVAPDCQVGRGYRVVDTISHQDRAEFAKLVEYRPNTKGAELLLY